MGMFGQDEFYSVNTQTLNNSTAINQQNIVIELSIWYVGLNNLDSIELLVPLLNGSANTKQIPLLHTSYSQNIMVNIPLIGLIDERDLITTIGSLKNESNRLNN
tara:strand:+ start:146 stop:457 length:312 start_codon:yes stop_codon:yes gene_type:complete